MGQKFEKMGQKFEKIGQKNCGPKKSGQTFDKIRPTKFEKIGGKFRPKLGQNLKINICKNRVNNLKKLGLKIFIKPKIDQRFWVAIYRNRNFEPNF